MGKKPTNIRFTSECARKCVFLHPARRKSANIDL
jgi:hypothetical protein